MISDVSLALAQRLAGHYKNACLAEIEALKPGNVHIFADGHGMRVQDFMHSAEASSAVITQLEVGLGKRIYRCIDATWQAVGCNTNLGIVLLCAPIIQAALQTETGKLRQQLAQVITSTTQEDAEWLFKAIQLAKPAGLGQADVHDVHTPADCTLSAAMKASSARDLIGLQYNNDFLNVFDEGLPHYQQALAQWEQPAWATTFVYLYWLSHHLDSHIVRKYGLKTAKTVQEEAQQHYVAFQSQANPKQYFSDLMQFDASLKARNLNPGTSADLTVATVLLHRLMSDVLV